ncbi:hypothetical protein [Microlunatus soli]|uniref:Galactose mutarotase n=1 Tax=Microlunatus soli TaxID=630515 RepID=A0A1H1TDT9_9ACTN|nr:hypothetical protein [Microlunatus soli]SDS58390.1 hypothetical protein SAMN04489812_2357 [Microlunatus soli]
MTLRLSSDLQHGGRWTSLRSADREWLWRHPDPAIHEARDIAISGQDFVDAGGAEECFPTVRGAPDHGAAWTAPWTPSEGPSSAGCDVAEAHLQRTVVPGADGLTIDYRIQGSPGLRFTHAVHALLDLGPQARIEITGRPPMRVLDHPTLQQSYWPQLGAVDAGRLLPVDGTAYAMIIDCAEVVVVDGSDRLRLRWEVTTGEASTSLMYWRNLDGWPAAAPYRTIGIEPMIGRTAEPAADPEAAAVLDRSGELRWRLTLSEA